MAYQRISRRALMPLLIRKNYSTKGTLINLSKDDVTGISIVSMNRQPVNSLNYELLVEFRETLDEVYQNGSTGVVITSSLPNIFSAGLDFMEMYKPDVIRARKFWNEVQELWLKLYSSSIPTSAAINGSCPAGACALAMACEYRVFVEGKYGIGLNEARMGFIVPVWFQNAFIDTIGYRRSEAALLKGTLFSPQEALKIGLVDELTINKDDAISKCQEYINSVAKNPAIATATTKQELRGRRIAWLKENREADTTRVINFITQPKVQVTLNTFMQAVKKNNQYKKE